MSNTYPVKSYADFMNMKNLFISTHVPFLLFYLSP